MGNKEILHCDFKMLLFRQKLSYELEKYTNAAGYCHGFFYSYYFESFFSCFEVHVGLFAFPCFPSPVIAWRSSPVPDWLPFSHTCPSVFLSSVLDHCIMSFLIPAGVLYMVSICIFGLLVIKCHLAFPSLCWVSSAFVSFHIAQIIIQIQ